MKKCICIALLIIMGALITSCMAKPLIIEQQTEYHEEIIDIEEYLLQSMSTYYMFRAPEIDYERKKITIDIVFLTSYVNDENKDKSYLQVMEETRLLVNEYLDDNPDYYLNNDFCIIICFYEAPEYNNNSMPYERYGLMMNDVNLLRDHYLCQVEYEGIVNSYISGSVTFEGVREISLDYQYMTDVDKILELLRDMPDIETVRVRPVEVMEALAHQRPDLTFE